MQPKPRRRGRRPNENEYEDQGNGITALHVRYRPKPPSEPQTVTALIDTAESARVQAHNWTANPVADGKFYLRSRIGGRYVYLHRFIMNCPPHLDTDHVNRDPRDNRRVNLRNVSHAENLRNRSPWAKPDQTPTETETTLRAAFPNPPRDLNLSKVPACLARLVQFAVGLTEFFLEQQNPDRRALQRFKVSVNGSVPLYPVTAVRRAVWLWNTPNGDRDKLRRWAKTTLAGWLVLLLSADAGHIVRRDDRDKPTVLTWELTTAGGEVFGPSWHGFLPTPREVADAMWEANRLSAELIWVDGKACRGYRGAAVWFY